MAAPLPKGTAMPPEETSAESTETSTTPETAEPTTGQQSSTTTEASFDPSSLSPEAQAYLKDQIEKAGFKARDNARTKAAEEARQQLMKEWAEKLGWTEGEQPPSAEELSAHLEQAQADAYKSGVETQLYRLERRLGFDAEAMLDSNRAMNDLISALDENEGAGDLVPGSPEFAKAIEAAATKALEKHPRLKATGSTGPRPDPSQGARGSTGPSQLSREDVRRLAKEGKHQEIEKARLEGRLNDLLSSKQ